MYLLYMYVRLEQVLFRFIIHEVLLTCLLALINLNVYVIKAQGLPI